MKGLGKDKTMFRIGARQAYRNDKCLNTKELIGDGIYCTPHISTSISYTNKGVKIQKGDKN